MHPNADFDDELEDLRQTDSEPDRAKRDAMIGRALTRHAFWRHALDTEQYEDFRPEKRRRCQVEQALIDGLKAGDSIFALLRTYQREAVHRSSELLNDDRKKTQASLSSTMRKRTDLLEQLRLTPQRSIETRKDIQQQLELTDTVISRLNAALRALDDR